VRLDDFGDQGSPDQVPVVERGEERRTTENRVIQHG